MKLKKYSSEKSDALSRKLKSYSALTGAFLAAGAAHAQITYTDINPDTLIQNSSYDVDMDNDGIADFKITHFGSSTFNSVNIASNTSHSSNRVIAKAGSGSFYYPIRLNAMAPIGNSVNGFASFAVAPAMTMAWYSSSGTFGYWGNSSGYLGVEFKTGGNTFYGWIDCEVAAGGTSVTIKGYAYESTPGALIHAGDTAVTTAINEKTVINKIGNFFPNAVRNGKTFIQIDAKEFSDLKIEVINGMGQILQTAQRKLIAGKNLVQLNVSALSAGTYFVKLMQGDQSYFRKVMISR